ncbi:unnamed protein product [Mucor hiemalis]
MPQPPQQKQSFIIPKLLYICLYSLYGSALAYIAVYYSEVLHLSSNQIGIILAISPFVQVVACPLWTFIADTYPTWHGPIMGMLAIIGGSSVIALDFLPKWIGTDEKGFSTSLSPRLLIDTDSNNETVMFVTAFCALIFAFFGSPNCALVDSAVLRILEDQKLLYGNQRLWGSVSNGIFILVVGLLISKYGINISFLIFFVGLASFVILSMLFVKFEHQMIPKEEEEDNITTTTPDVHDVLSVSQQEGEGSEESRSLLLAGKSTTTAATAAAIAGTNYMYDPSMRTWSHHNQQQQQQQQTNNIHLSRRQSEQSQFTRRDSFANTLYLTDDQTQFNHLLTNTRSTTSMMALDAQIEANQELLLQRQESYPSLGLVLSYIPSLDTSLSAFALLGQQSEGQQQQQQHEDNISIIIPDKSILKSLHVCTFMTSVLLYGIAHSTISQFLFLLLKDLGMSSSTMGWTGPIGGAAEMMTFWISRQVMITFFFCVLHCYVSIVNFSAFYKCHIMLQNHKI